MKYYLSGNLYSSKPSNKMNTEGNKKNDRVRCPIVNMGGGPCKKYCIPGTMLCKVHSKPMHVKVCCTGLITLGKSCKRKCLPGATYCNIHDPNLILKGSEHHHGNIFNHTVNYYNGVTVSKDKPDKKDSISSLINIPLTQSQCIKLGTHIENIIREFLCSYEHIEDVRPKKVKGESERDHLFCIGGHKIYAELKCNLNLDTEKLKKTCQKVLKVSGQEKCDGYLLAIRYLNDIPDCISKKYESVKVVGVSQYFKLFGVPCPFGGNEMIYKIWLNQVARELVYKDGDINRRIQQLYDDINELNKLKC